MADQVKKGDEVSWNWGSGQPSGKVAEVKEGRAEVTSNKGNTISKNGTKEDPAVVIERSGLISLPRSPISHPPFSGSSHRDRWELFHTSSYVGNVDSPIPLADDGLFCSALCMIGPSSMNNVVKRAHELNEVES
ncbi:hypothetical protein TREMEDRAFT_64628 [Tremella mesenterica DSM 1558]|uniref:uncharacterized protein n=1 Tax=Tremella mesenterica (strain ATCC 24925 / CBS 8224 / DSM 1558 / NBRC 9311 / NRRL Y-6157 / RJB 2259-6 / UBC 559-6) TaxID=578456 RepID=UPI0003F48EA8|nr:uncharacterized protein TREMEDRAFT_64628 [Tremella mesenterica DSM 1558]EIW67376.1 hypothetical protein TREMEDRAFT_64628 [Tremella mesenterica DSM 1558]